MRRIDLPVVKAPVLTDPDPQYPLGPNTNTAYGPSGPYGERGPFSRPDSDS